MSQRSRADIRAAILSRVKRGETIERAAAAECYSDSAVWSWAQVDVDFRAALLHARRIGSKTTRRKAAFLEAIAGGTTVAEGAALAGVTERVPSLWRRTDPAFEAAYAAICKGHKHPAERTRFDALLRCVTAGDDVRAAMAALGYCESTYRYWRANMPTRWEALQRAMAAGEILREGRAA